ncbi:helix-turn-helix domain-containing protein [Ichthyenterobacterium magnum]|uniref:helix-turn-helix domain-containing protein n=1 Tax=Ichthyenterobacterium magnum TaxID=1230530 RepID=UPI0013C37AFA|nr:helix-turn-helix domain-containing protein [Ichthyenterobacterium magnum]
MYFIFEFAFSTYRNFANIQNRFIENWSLVMWTLFILILSYTIVKSPKLIFESIAEPKRRKQKYEGLDFFEIEKELLSYIETSKPFLDNNLTLPQLAKSIKLTPHQLSFALNTHLKTTFYDFVNTYRVKYAAQLLESGEHLKLSIFGVAQVSGFKSKASFYSFFKKQFNTTPSKFIEKL